MLLKVNQSIIEISLVYLECSGQQNDIDSLELVNDIIDIDSDDLNQLVLISINDQITTKSIEIKQSQFLILPYQVVNKTAWLQC